MSKTKVQEEPSLDSKIAVIKAEIEKVQAEIETGEQEFHECTEALSLIKDPPRFPVASGVLKFYDALKQQQEALESEHEREAEIFRYQNALELCKESIENRKTELTRLKLELAEIKEQQDWEINFLPLAEKFKAGYCKPFEALDEQIRHAQTDVDRYQSALKTLKEWEIDPQVKTPKFADASPERYLELLQNENGLLTSNIKRLEELQAEKTKRLANLNDDPNFRNWVKGRVKIDNALQSFLKFQEGYVSVLSELRQTLEQNPGIVEFEVRELKNPVFQVRNENGKITLI